jgi:hypothetical protein
MNDKIIMNDELIKVWREDFEKELLSSPYSSHADISRSEKHPNEYNQQVITHKWLWYLAACRKRQKETESAMRENIGYGLRNREMNEEITHLKTEIYKRDRLLEKVSDLISDADLSVGFLYQPQEWAKKYGELK